MDRTVITKRINRLACDIEKLKSTLAAIENTDIARYPENYNMLATDAALRSELIACRMRRLVFQSTDTKKPEHLASAGGSLPTPVHILGEEPTACGVIPDLSRK